MQATTKNATDKRRRGLSNVMGSLLLIILTAVSALLLGHYAFATMTATQHNPSLAITDVSVINPGGNAPTNTLPVYVEFTVINNGNDPINITGVGSFGAFHILPKPVTVQPGQAVNFEMQFFNASGGYNVLIGIGPNWILSWTFPKSSIQSSTGTLAVGTTGLIGITAVDLNTGLVLSTQAPAVVQD